MGAGMWIREQFRFFLGSLFVMALYKRGKMR